MSTEGSGETPSAVPSLPGAPEQTYMFPKAKGHSRSVSHGGVPTVAGLPPRPLRSALRGHQRALSHGQIGEGAPPAAAAPGTHTRAASRTDFILPPGHREPAGVARAASTRGHHSRQASRSDSIYTIRRESSAGPLERTLHWLMRKNVEEADNRHLIVVPNHLVPDKTPAKEHPNGDRCGNQVCTTKYTLLSFLPKNLFEQFHRVANVYFIFIVLMNWVPALNAFGKEVAMLPVLFVLTVTAVKDLFEDRRRHVSDKKINNLYCRVYKKSAENYVRTKWRDVRVGDIIHLSNNEAVPADMVLLHSSSPSGVCYLDTCNLDGETNLKQRVAAPGFRGKDFVFHPLKFRSTVEVGQPTTKIYRFNGCLAHPNGERVPLSSEILLLRDCTIKNTDFVEGIVVYAGHETKAMLNNGGPRYKCSKLEKRMNKDIIWSVLVLLFLCLTGAVGCKLWLDQYYSQNSYKNVPFLTENNSPGNEGLLKFWTFIIVLQVMIPVSLYVTIEMTKLFQVYYIHQDVRLYDPVTDSRAECCALNITEELGQISYFFTDKTGTLTENKMVFRRCTVGGVDYNHPPGPPAQPCPELPPIVTPVTEVSPNRRMLQHLQDANDGKHTQNVKEFLLILAVCNTVVVSLPHVDRMSVSTSVEPQLDKTRAKPLRSDTVRSNDKYARLAESRSTTPSPPPSIMSPLRIRLPRHKSEDKNGKPKLSTVAVPRFEAESPDELALAEAALAYGYELRARTPDTVELGVRGVVTRLTVLRVQGFDAVRKCMSIALLTDDEQVVLYVKGADSTVLGALCPLRPGSAEAAAYERTRALIADYSRAGLRTLVMAKRVLTRERWDEWVRAYTTAATISEGRERRTRECLARLESELTLVGATGVEDRLQEDVPRTVRALLDAGIIVWVLTGDKPETAVNIAYSAALFSQSDQLLYLMSKDKEHAESTIKSYLESGGGSGSGGRALVVDGRTITYILDRRSGLVAPFLSLARRCSAVLCCRATPLQKAYIVKAVKEELGVTTLAIGDGANDVSMIQTADVGIGISGQEGRQAMMAADFTLSRFKFVERLLLVHGHWSYDRIARMVLYFFTKNSTFVFMVFWSQLYCGFSTTVMIDQMHWMLYNLFFTAFSPAIMGVYERVAPASLLMERPGLYKNCRRGLTYQTHTYWTTLAEAVYISVVIFFPVCLTYYDTDVDILVFGMVNMSCCLSCMWFYAVVETRSWTYVHLFGLLGSMFGYVVLSLFFHTVCVTLFVPSSFHVIFHAFGDARHWLLVVFCTVTALAPRMLVYAIRNSISPPSLKRAVMARRRFPRQMLYAAHYHTTTSSAHVYRSTDEDGLRKSSITDVPEVT